MLGAFANNTNSQTNSSIRLSPWHKLFSQVGVGTPNCPSCNWEFEKTPQRKRACPKCGEVFYSRTRLIDNTKVLLTESQAPEVEKQNGLLLLVRSNGLSLPLDQLSVVYAQAFDWGLYRNTRFALAELNVHRGCFGEALRLYFEVSILDLIGPLTSVPRTQKSRSFSLPLTRREDLSPVEQ